MHRRSLLKGIGSAAAAMAAPALVRAQAQTTLRFIPQADLTFLDPHLFGSWVIRNHGTMVFDTLYGLDRNFQPAPQMAEGHTVEADGLVWKIRLRPGLVWHDGTPVLARDCVASLNRWGTRNSFGSLLKAATEELSAPDDRTIQYRLKRPFPRLIDVLAHVTAPMCAMMPERLAMTDPFKPVPEVIGSGPFRFKADERMPGSRNVYERFDRYKPSEARANGWTSGPKIAHFDRVIWTTMPDPSTAAAAMQAGEQDWWEFVAADLQPMLAARRNLKVEVTDTLGVLALLRPNHLQPPFNNPGIRRAMLQAVDQTNFMQAITPGAEMYNTPYGFFCPKTPMASDAGLAPLTGKKDLAALKRMVQEAGYNGEKAVMLVPTDYAWIKGLGDVAADTMQSIGLNVDYVATDWGTMLARREKKDPLDKGGWSCLPTGQAGVDHLGPAANTQIRANGTGHGSQPGWPESPKLEALRNAWLDAPDVPTQKQLCQEIQLQAMQDVPYFPLGQYFQATAYRSDIAGVQDGFATFWNVKRNG
jgi:peptide/nickel transport system substrate-binding protein